jgi:hypothetical protein
MRGKDAWMYRAILLGWALKHLGYDPRNVMDADKEQLSKWILERLRRDNGGDET